MEAEYKLNKIVIETDLALLLEALKAKQVVMMNDNTNN